MSRFHVTNENPKGEWILQWETHNRDSLGQFVCKINPAIPHDRKTNQRIKLVASTTLASRQDVVDAGGSVRRARIRAIHCELKRKGYAI